MCVGIEGGGIRPLGAGYGRRRQRRGRSRSAAARVDVHGARRAEADYQCPEVQLQQQYHQGLLMYLEQHKDKISKVMAAILSANMDLSESSKSTKKGKDGSSSDSDAYTLLYLLRCARLHPVFCSHDWLIFICSIMVH